MTYNYLKKLDKKTQARLLDCLITKKKTIVTCLNRQEFVVKETPNYMIAFIDEDDFNKAIKVLKGVKK